MSKISARWQWIAILLSVLLGIPPKSSLLAQAAPAQLNIVIVEGEGAVNNLRQRVVREPIVRVEDENHRPVAGAVVTFLLPGNGAGGTFANGAKSLTVTTGADGRATARGIKANNVSGQYQIQVTASIGNVTATATIAQSNAAAAAAGGAAAAGVSGKLIAVLVAVGAAAAAGAAVALTRGGNNTPATQTTALTPGSPSVGGPH